MGYDLYALSPQNEPALSTGYNSCSYYPGEFADMFKAVASRFKAANCPINLTYADNITWGGNGWLAEAYNKIVTDRVADSIGNILSCHYSMGPDKNKDYFGRMGGLVKQRTERLGGTNRTMVWNTEFNGMYNSWEERWENTPEGGAWSFITEFFMALQYDFTAVIIWALVDPYEGRKPEDNKYSLFYSRNSTDLELGPLFRLAQTIFRTVRPGAVKVEAVPSNSNVWTVAYKNPVEKTTTVLLMNRASSPQTVTLSGAGLPPTFTMYQTSPQQNFEDMGDVSSTSSITLPVKSLTALYTIPEATSVAPQKGSARNTAANMPNRVGQSNFYNLRGQQLVVSAQERQQSPQRSSGLVLEADRSTGRTLRHLPAGTMK